MSTLKSNVIEPATGTNLSLGAAGDLIDVTSDTLQLNTWKDSGGNTLFTSDGSGNLSSINSALDIGGGPNLISTQTASTSSSVSFTSGIDSTYDKYMFVFLNIRGTGLETELQFQTGSSYNTTTTTTAFWAKHSENGGTSGLAYSTSHDAAQSTSMITIGFDNGSGADYAYDGTMNLFSPASTTYVKQFYSRMLTCAQARDQFIAGYINTTAAVTQIKFQMSSGTFDGTIKMYGCR